MALGSFAEGFTKGFASIYSVKLEEEKEERLLKKTFLQEQKKLKLAKEEKSKQNKSAAMGVQEMYGLTEAQANTLFVRLDTGMITPDKLDDLARQFAAQNSRQNQSVDTSPVVAEGVSAPVSTSAEDQTEIMLGNKPAAVQNKVKIDTVEPTVTSSTYTNRPTAKSPITSAASTLPTFTATDQLAAIFNPQLTNASFLDSKMDSAADYRNEVFKAGDKWFYNLSDEDKRRVFKDTQQEYMWRSALAKDQSVLLKDTDRRRPIERAQPPEQNFLETAYDSTLAFLGFGEPLEETPPPADYAITEQLAAQDKELLKINGMTQEYLDETRPARLKDLQEKYLATPQFADVDPQTLEDLTTLRSIEKLMENDDFKKYWLNHLTQKEYKRHIDNGDTDGVARTRTLISMTAGPDMADYWDGTDIGAQKLAAQLDKLEGGAVIKNEEFLGRKMFGKPLSQGEMVRQGLAQARNSGMLPPEEQYVSEAKKAEEKRVDRDKLLKRHRNREKVIRYRAQNPLATADKIRATESTQASLVTDGAELTPNTVGAKFTGMPYVKAGLARMPIMAKAIEPLDFTKFKDVSPVLLEQQSEQYYRLAEKAKNNGNSADAAMYTEYGGALKALSTSIGPKQDEFLTTPIAELTPEQVGSNLFLVRNYIENPPAKATPEQLDAARYREDILEKLVKYNYDNEKFDLDLFLKNPDLYVAIRQTNPQRYNNVDLPVIKRWANSQVTNIDFSKLKGVDSLPMIAVHIDAVDKVLASTTEKDNPILYNSLKKTRSELKAAAQGINDSLQPKELKLEALGQDYLIAVTAEKVAEENMDRLGIKVLNETGGQIQLADHPEYRESLKIHAEAEATAQAKLALLQDGIKIQSLIDPNAVKEYKWASTLGGIRVQKVDVGDQLSAATSPEEIQKLSKRLDTLDKMESALVFTATQKAAQNARAEAEAFGVPVLMADGKINFVPADSVKEVEGAVRLQGNPSKIQEEINQSKARDAQRLTEANRAVENTLTMGAYAGELAEIVQQEPAVLTSLAGGASNLLTKLQAEYSSGEKLVLKARVEELAREEGLLGKTQSIDQLAGMSLSEMSDLASKRSLFLAKQLQLIFASGGAEGTAGNAMSNQDFNNLRSVISANSTRNPQTYLANLRGYVSTKESQSTSLVNNLRTTGILSNYIQAISPNNEYADAYIRKNTPATIEEYIKDRPEDVRAVNYQKLFAQNAVTVSKTKQEAMDVRSRNLLVQTGVSEENINKVMTQLNAAVNISKTAADIDQAKRLLIQEWGSKYNVNPQLSKRILDMYLPLATGK